MGKRHGEGMWGMGNGMGEEEYSERNMRGRDVQSRGSMGKGSTEQSECRERGTRSGKGAAVALALTLTEAGG